MNERIPESPPKIKPMTDNENRPLFSVMIPSYNCINYLPTAINSVLSQDLGPEKMQIEVIDDCSTDGDVAGLVESLGKGRIKFYQQKKNVGSLRNFETCLNRARGHYIHLLHGDDYVKQGFYKEIQFLFEKFPEAGAAFSNHFTVSSIGNEDIYSQPLASQPVIIENFLDLIAQNNFLQPPAIVVKREVYENLGGFFAVHFGEDWEMWTRISSKYKMAYTPERLAVYRSHNNNTTYRSHKSFQSVDDLTKVIDIIQNYLPDNKKVAYKKLAKTNYSKYFSSVAHQLYYVHEDPNFALSMSKKLYK
jgi:glycosyltransferase involved in cell wall biosynthesis